MLRAGHHRRLIKLMVVTHSSCNNYHWLTGPALDTYKVHARKHANKRQMLLRVENIHKPIQSHIYKCILKNNTSRFSFFFSIIDKKNCSSIEFVTDFYWKLFYTIKSHLNLIHSSYQKLHTIVSNFKYRRILIIGILERLILIKLQYFTMILIVGMEWP